MESLLREFAHYVSLSIETMAVVIIALGAIEAVIGILRALVRSSGAPERTAVWFSFARWLVAGMTLQLAADVIGTSFEPTWNDLGRLGVIALIRTFLSYFLDKEMEARLRQQQTSGSESAP